jgi:aspartate aminotransferase
MQGDLAERDERMQVFHDKLKLLVDGLNGIDGIDCLMPGGTFYAFPHVAPIGNRLGITSHGLAMYLLEAADDDFGIACLGGECFGDAGQGFLRFSCAESDERLQQAIDFLPVAVGRTDRVGGYLEANPKYKV